MFWGSVLIAVVATVFYHLFQQATPATAHPLVALCVTYITAALLCIGLTPFFPLQTSWLVELRRLNWASAALGLSVLGIEVGFLLAYRAGWDITIGGLVVNAATTLVLIPIGVLAFSERLSPERAIGMALCVVGLWLINQV